MTWLLAVVSTAFPLFAEDATVTRVVAAWEARAARIRTATIEWTLRTTDRKGIFTEFAAKNGGPGGEFPARDTTREAKYRLLFDGRRLRIDVDGQAWHTDTGQLHAEQKTRVFDGERLEISMPAGTTRAGTLMSQAEYPYLHSAEVLPIGLFLAPLNKEFGATAMPPLAPAPFESVAPGEICLAGQQGMLPIWIEARRPDVIRRFQVRKPGGAHWIEGEIEWTTDASIGPVPTRWLVTTFDDDGQLRQVHDARVTRCQLNTAIDEAAWRLRYPPGAAFHDMIERKEYVVDSDGELRPAGVAQAGAGNRGRGWLGYSLLAAALLAAASWWHSRRNARRSPF